VRPLLIIGYGNSLRSDDGLGWHVSQELLRTIDSAAVEIISCGQLTPDLAEPISHAGQVLFIDVARSGPPGEVICKRVTPASATAAFSHQLSAEGLLGITRVLFGDCPEANLFSIAGHSFEPGDSVSPQVADCMPALLSLIKELVVECGKSPLL
jgi:hydrogenase maturation protease